MRQKRNVAVDMRDVVRDFLSPILEQKSVRAPRMEEEDETRVAHLGELIVRARAHVSRERVCHEIEDAPDPEGNTRFPQQLAQIGRGWAALVGSDVVTEEGMSLIFRVGLDSIPPRKCDVLRALMHEKSPYALGLPNAVVERAIEDLEAVGLVTKPIKGPANLSNLAIELLRGAKLDERIVSPQFLQENEK